MIRPCKTDYYLNIAAEVAKRSTCLRRKFGAVIVNNDQIISTGYNGAPRGAENCDDRGICKRSQMGIAPGERYELCRSVHAEANAIINAGRDRTTGGVLYLVGIDAETGNHVVYPPCFMCKRMILNAGIEIVIVGSSLPGGVTYYPNQWKEEL